MINTDPPDQSRFDALRSNLYGELLDPGDRGYNEARRVWNGIFDKYPTAIAKCSGVADVIASINFVRENDCRFSVKGGGHHVSGTAVCDNGLVIDLSEIDGIWVDVDDQVARVQAGATWGAVDHETQAFGLATVGGQDPNIGVAGMTLGGGIGWLSRKYGLTIDNVQEVNLVTANGQKVTASESENPDLFWALRGGGGNYGIATSFKYQLHEIGPEVLAGSVIHSIEDAPKLAHFYEEFMEQAPREVRTLFGIMVMDEEGYLPEELHNQRVAIIVSLYAGNPSDGDTELEPLRNFGSPISDSIRKRPYLAFQRAGASNEHYRTYIRSNYLKQLSQEAIDTIVKYEEEIPSPTSTVFVSHRGGAETEPEVDATAYPHRQDAYHVLIEARWSDSTSDAEHKEWVCEFHRSIQQFTTDEAAMNFLTHDEPQKRLLASYGENYERLVEVKNMWDPENRFRMNQNIVPTVNN